MCCNSCGVQPGERSRQRPITRSWMSLGIYLTVTLFWTTALIIPSVGSSSPCDYNGDHSMANCSLQHLTYVPETLHKNILIMDFSDNSLPTIANQSFSAYQNINELFLRNNSIHKIEGQALQGLSNLKVLDLSNNQLKSVPSRVLLTVARSLSKLVLSANKIRIIRELDFSKLVKLTHLDINGNLIQHVSLGAFSNLNNLKVIKLHRNNLKSLPSEAFAAFPAKQMSEVQLGYNPWKCDCDLRWLWMWLNDTDTAVSDPPVRCDDPHINREKVLTDLVLDELACKIQMKTSQYESSLMPGANQTLKCKYKAVPEAPALWQVIKMKGTPVNVLQTSSNKFSIKSFTETSKLGELHQISEMTILNFQYEDIAEYECLVENILGAASTDFRLTLEGVPFDSVTPDPPVGAAGEAGLDARSVVIAVAVVSGVVLIVAIAVVITCGVSRLQRRKQIKQDAIVENVKQHFINNSEVVSMGDLDASKLSAKLNGNPPDDDQVDGKHSDDHGSDHTNDSTMTQLKRPLALEETDPLYIFEQPGSPLANGNTYVSFGSELADPAEDSYTTLPLRTQTLPHHGYGVRHPNARGYESSHAGSATPLLSDRYTPSAFDSDEPVEDYAQYPVYDSLTNSLHHPSHVTHHNYPSAGDSNSLHTSFQYPSHNPNRDHTYSTVDSNSGFYSLANRAPSPAKPRNDSLSSYSSGERGERGTNPRPDPARRLSSFQYPQPSTPVVSGIHAPSPRTPVTARSTLALAPRYAPDSSYVSDSADIYGYHHHPRPSPHPSDYRDYRDYREMRYPGMTSTPPVPPGQIAPGKKSMSMSVGNLGYAPLVPGSSPIPIGGGSIGTGPRKPPRMYQSREYMELTPQDRVNSPYIGSHDSGSNGGSYITSPEAQQYSQNYGITPGTPV